MKVSKSSWHYKWQNLMLDDKGNDDPKTVCSYFWTFVAKSLFNIFSAFAFLFILALVGYPILQIWITYPIGIWIPSFGIWCILGYVGITSYRSYLRHEGKLAYKNPNPGPIAMFVEAKHRKICPFIEYEK